MRNHYRGINPHLNSRLQTPGTDGQPAFFSTFHATYIVHIADFLNEVLPPDYVAHNEDSLQTRGIDEGLDMDPEERLHGLVIRQIDNSPGLGRFITRVELLSPSNKPGGTNHASYLARRLEMLQNGIPLVEIDLWHETRPINKVLPIYAKDLQSYPYTISVIDPRPNVQNGQVHVYGFHVDEPIQPVLIPLAGDEMLLFNFDRVYQRSFTSRRWHFFVDQTDEPARFETYSRADQERIREIMNKNAGGT